MPKGTRAYEPRHRGIAYEILELESAACFVPDDHYKLLDGLVDEASTRIAKIGPFTGSIAAKRRLAVAMSRVIGEVLEDNHFELFVDTEALGDTLEAHVALGRGPAHLFDCDTSSFIYLTIGQALNLPLRLVEITLPSGYGHNFIRWQITPDALLDWDTNGRGECRTPVNIPAHQGRALEPEEIIGYAHALRAKVWERNNAFSNALQDLRTATQMYPTSSLAHNNLAWLVATKEFPDRHKYAGEGLTHAQKAVSLLKNASHLDTLACSYAFAGDMSKALLAIREALTLNPYHSDFRSRLERIEHGRDCTGFP